MVKGKRLYVVLVHEHGIRMGGLACERGFVCGASQLNCRRHMDGWPLCTQLTLIINAPKLLLAFVYTLQYMRTFSLYIGNILISVLTLMVDYNDLVSCFVRLNTSFYL